MHVEDASQSLRYYSSKYEVKLILVVYIDLFLFLCGELSSFVFKDFQKYFLSHIFFCLYYGTITMYAQVLT